MSRGWFFSLVPLLVLILSLALYAAPPRPDLIVDGPTLAANVRTVSRYFPPGDCTINEGCVAAPGHRKVIMFATQVANIGTRELFLGDPNGNPLFHYDTCHGHDHFLGYAGYELLDGSGGLAAPGHKQAFCVADGFRYLNEPWVPTEPVYHCFYQGLSPGWADTYSAETACQWIDVTDVSPGDYVLSVTTNPLRVIEESNYANNITQVPVTLFTPDAPDLRIRLSDVDVRRHLIDPEVGTPCLGCIDGSGYRLLIGFRTQVTNHGTVDAFFGHRFDHPAVVADECHNHWHLNDSVSYELFAADGRPARPAVVRGMSFQDEVREIEALWSRTSAYFAGNSGFRQGLQAGWRSEEEGSLGCQSLDATGLPEGWYELRATIDVSGDVQESDETNNSVSISVYLADRNGIPHVPDGHFIPGEPLAVQPAPGGLTVTWEPAPCAQDYNLYYGAAATSFAYGYAGALCGLGTGGMATVALPDPPPGELIWFNVVATEGTVEGGHGFDSAGVERPLTGTGFCLITDTRPESGCPI